MTPYVSATLLKAYAVAEEADSDAVFDQLAAAVSRMFDRECEVADEFFLAAPATEEPRIFKGNNTKYINIGPYVPGSITVIDRDGTAVTLGDSDTYYEQGGYLVFYYRVLESSEITVTARFGFSEIPADIVQACIEMALMLWRRKDTAFSELSGVSTAVVAAELSPTFLAVTKRYREIYSPNLYFV